jgi:hypothetical protein
MQHRRRAIHLAQALTLAAALTGAAACASAPPEIARVLPQAQAAGQGRLTWWGFPVYDARLWVAPGFSPAELERHAFALELTYLRALRGTDIAQRSLEEMRRLAPVGDEQAQRWLARLREILPDVRAGDRIAGVHLPGRGARFLVNGRDAGEVEDARFAAVFFSIWLAPATAAPELRAALLGEVRQ